MIWGYSVEKILQFTGLILGTVGAVLLTVKQFRGWIVTKWNERQEYLKTRNAIPIMLKDIKEKVDVMDTRLQKVEHEVSPNGGGSMKDVLRIVKAEIEASNWLHYRPTFRTTSSGVNIFVNEAYCSLCGVSSDELMKLGWKCFAQDEEQADQYMTRWLQASKEFSQFSGRLRFKNSQNESRGEWLIKIRPLGPLENNKNEYLWHGSLYPFDQEAIEYCHVHNIPLH